MKFFRQIVGGLTATLTSAAVLLAQETSVPQYTVRLVYLVSADHQVNSNLVHAIALRWPEFVKLVICSLGTFTGKAEQVGSIGSSGTSEWQQSKEGMMATLPSQHADRSAIALKYLGRELQTP